MSHGMIWCVMGMRQFNILASASLRVLTCPSICPAAFSIVPFDCDEPFGEFCGIVAEVRDAIILSFTAWMAGSWSLLSIIVLFLYPKTPMHSRAKSVATDCSVMIPLRGTRVENMDFD